MIEFHIGRRERNAAKLLSKGGVLMICIVFGLLWGVAQVIQVAEGKRTSKWPHVRTTDGSPLLRAEQLGWDTQSLSKRFLVTSTTDN